MAYNPGVLILAAALLFQSAALSELREGLVALSGGNLASAREHLEAAAKQEPENAIVWASLAQAYRKSGEKQKAMQAAGEAARFGGDQPPIQHALAMFYASEGELRKAAEFERKYGASPAADADALARAAGLYLQAGDAPQAIETAKAAVARKDSAALHLLLGNAYAAGGDRAQAVLELKEAAQTAPDDEAAFDAAQGLLRAEAFVEAAGVLEDASKRSPKNPQLSLALGVAYYGLRRFPDAIHAFLKTIDLAPEVAQPYAFLGKILDQAGNDLPAIQSKFEALRSREPNNYLGHFLAARALIVSGGTPDQIEPLLKRSIALNDRFWESHFELGEALSRKREYAAAAAEMERAAKLNPTEPAIHFRLARLYDRLNAPEKAQAERELHEKLSAKTKPSGGMGAP